MKHSRLIYVLFILLSSMSITGQKPAYDFGNYSMQDFDIKECPFEPSASAMILYDIGKSSFERTDYGYFVYFRRNMRMKIFSKAGLRYAEFTIPVYNGSQGAEKIMEIKSNTYTLENGTVRTTAFNPKETYTQKLNENWDLKTFAIPDIMEGSVFEVTYTIRSPYIFNLRDWEFQHEIPVAYSEYTAVIDPYFEYSYLAQGIKMFDEYKSFPVRKDMYIHGTPNTDDMAYFFVLKNVPSFKDDEYITSADDYRIKINFQLAGYATASGSVTRVITTWPELISDLLKKEDFGKYLKQSIKKGEDILATMKLPSDDLEKARFIRSYVVDNFSFNGYDRFSPSNSLKDFLAKKTGNIAEMNLFYLGLLKAAGLDAEPVIISTRNHGKIKSDYPFVDAFNYVLVCCTIDNKKILADATESLLNFEEIPPRCLNETGLLVKEGEPKWISLISSVSSEKRTLTEFTFDLNDNKMRLKVNNIYSGYEAAYTRDACLSNYDSLSKATISVNSLVHDGLTITNKDKISEKLEISFNEEFNLETIDNKIILDPFAGKGLYENPFKEPTRNYPVDFNYKRIRSFESKIKIPAGYRLINKPQDLLVNNQSIRILYMIDDKTEGMIKVTALYELKKDSYPAESYKDLKGYYNLIVNKFNEEIILEPTGI